MEFEFRVFVQDYLALQRTLEILSNLFGSNDPNANYIAKLLVLGALIGLFFAIARTLTGARPGTVLKQTLLIVAFGTLMIGHPVQVRIIPYSGGQPLPPNTGTQNIKIPIGLALPLWLATQAEVLFTSLVEKGFNCPSPLFTTLTPGANDPIAHEYMCYSRGGMGAAMGALAALTSISTDPRFVSSFHNYVFNCLLPAQRLAIFSWGELKTNSNIMKFLKDNSLVYWYTQYWVPETHINAGYPGNDVCVYAFANSIPNCRATSQRTCECSCASAIQLLDIDLASLNDRYKADLQSSGLLAAATGLSTANNLIENIVKGVYGLFCDPNTQNCPTTLNDIASQALMARYTDVAIARVTDSSTFMLQLQSKTRGLISGWKAYGLMMLYLLPKVKAYLWAVSSILFIVITPFVFLIGRRWSYVLWMGGLAYAAAWGPVLAVINDLFAAEFTDLLRSYYGNTLNGITIANYYTVIGKAYSQLAVMGFTVGFTMPLVGMILGWIGLRGYAPLTGAVERGAMGIQADMARAGTTQGIETTAADYLRTAGKLQAIAESNMMSPKAQTSYDLAQAYASVYSGHGYTHALSVWTNSQAWQKQLERGLGPEEKAEIQLQQARRAYGESIALAEQSIALLKQHKRQEFADKAAQSVFHAMSKDLQDDGRISAQTQKLVQDFARAAEAAGINPWDLLTKHAHNHMVLVTPENKEGLQSILRNSGNARLKKLADDMQVGDRLSLDFRPDPGRGLVPVNAEVLRKGATWDWRNVDERMQATLQKSGMDIATPETGRYRRDQGILHMKDVNAGGFTFNDARYNLDRGFMHEATGFFILGSIKGLTKEQFAKKLGLSPDHISDSTFKDLQNLAEANPNKRQSFEIDGGKISFIIEQGGPKIKGNVKREINLGETNGRMVTANLADFSGNIVVLEGTDIKLGHEGQFLLVNHAKIKKDTGEIVALSSSWTGGSAEDFREFIRAAFGRDINTNSQAWQEITNTINRGEKVGVRFEDGRLYVGVGTTTGSWKEYLVSDKEVVDNLNQYMKGTETKVGSRIEQDSPVPIYLEKTPWGEPGWVMWQGTLKGHEMKGNFWLMNSEGRIVGTRWEGSFLVDDPNPQEALRKAQDREHPVALGVYKPQWSVIMEKTDLSGGANIDNMAATQAVLTMSKGFKSEDPVQRADAEPLAKTYFHGQDHVLQAFAKQYARELDILAQKHNVEIETALRGYAYGQLGIGIPFTSNKVTFGVRAELQKLAQDATSVNMLEAASLTIIQMAKEGKISDQEAADNLRALRQWVLDVSTNTTPADSDGKPEVDRNLMRTVDGVTSLQETGSPGSESPTVQSDQESLDALKGLKDLLDSGPKFDIKR